MDRRIQGPGQGEDGLRQGRGGQAGEPLTFTRPFLFVSDVNERVFRHLLYRDPREPKRTLYFAPWRGEELGLLGSTCWAKHPTDGVKLENIDANCDNDMVGLGDRIGAQGGLNFPGARDVIMRNQEPDEVGNLAMSDMAARLLSAGRVQVVGGGDGARFGSSGAGERGREALKAFDSAGVVLQLVDPPARLLDSMLENAKKGFLVTGMTTVPDAALAKKLAEKNVVVAVDFDMAAPQAVATRLVDLIKALNGSGNLVLTTHERSAATAMGNAEQSPRQKALDAAKQPLYLALVKDGWTKEEIYAMVGVTPPRTGPVQMPPPPAPRLGGNLGKLAQ